MITKVFIGSEEMMFRIADGMERNVSRINLRDIVGKTTKPIQTKTMLAALET
jgi:hypothetical protein